MEGSLTGGNRLSSQLVSMFFRSEDISPIYPRKSEESFMRMGVGGEYRCVLLPSPSPIPIGPDRAASPVHPQQHPPHLIFKQTECMGATANS